MALQHTDGEWFHVGGHDKRAAPYIRRKGDQVGTPAIAMVCARGTLAEQRANARLIANARRMALALQRVAPYLAELPPELQDGRLLAIRQDVVEAIKAATPEYYGLPQE
jgi:hypothetical protein